jgi:hypothetical protein
MVIIPTMSMMVFQSRSYYMKIVSVAKMQGVKEYVLLMETVICWIVCAETLSGADLTLLYPFLQKMVVFGRTIQVSY